MKDFVRIHAILDSAEAENVADRGWRLRVLRDEDDAQAVIFLEQVQFPERVAMANAARFNVQHTVRVDDVEAAWLRRALAEAFGEISDDDGLKAEVATVRTMVGAVTRQRDRMSDALAEVWQCAERAVIGQQYTIETMRMIQKLADLKLPPTSDHAFTLSRMRADADCLRAGVITAEEFQSTVLARLDDLKLT